jgi:AICAR transformylase/IMP cyclohydrolase PurH
VTVVPDPVYYPAVVAELDSSGAVGDALRLRLAAAAFDITSRYDAAIASHFAGLK